MKRGKNYTEKSNTVDREKLYLPNDAVKLVKESGFAKFDESIELHFNLGIDPRHADQQLRGTTTLPHGSGKTIKILVVTSAGKVEEAKAAGADFVGSDDVVEKIQKGWLDFDLILATPDMMGKIGRLGRILGAKGLMPNPKSGTVVQDIAKAVKEFKSGKVEYRNDKAGLLHFTIGKLSFNEDAIRENFDAIYDLVLKIKPSKAKGIYIKSLVLCSTMGPGIQIETQKVKWKEN
ncbi:50S ribosomal protein L1 [bacterium]|jgi:large subunit ribosomal protein L1|nr:50S ribosomal protein L1 [bacterium]